MNNRPQRRFETEEEILKAIDKCHADIAAKRSQAACMRTRHRPLDEFEQCEVKKLERAMERLEDNKLKRLGERLSEFRTQRMPFLEDESIPQ